MGIVQILTKYHYHHFQDLIFLYLHNFLSRRRRFEIQIELLNLRVN